jgi:hypothetical protein
MPFLQRSCIQYLDKFFVVVAVAAGSSNGSGERVRRFTTEL